MGFFFKSQLLEAHDHTTLTFFSFKQYISNSSVAGEGLKMLSKCTARLRNQMPNDEKPNHIAMFKSLKF